MSQQPYPEPQSGAYPSSTPNWADGWYPYYAQTHPYNSSASASTSVPSTASLFSASTQSGSMPLPPSTSSQTTTSTPAAASIAADPPRKRARVLPLDASERDKALARIRGMTDVEAWDEDGDSVVEAASQGWTSSAYRHYNVTVQQGTNSTTGARELKFVFSCKHRDPAHTLQFRKRMATNHGTTNLLRTAKACDQRGRRSPSAISLETVKEYTEARHRLLIALRCCVSKRPFEMVRDEIYALEVDLLSGEHRNLPSPQVVQNDTLTIYDGMSQEVLTYFKNRTRAVHVVNDGWSTPIHTSTLGFLTVWENGGRLYRSLIELITLTERHTGAYLAEELAKGLKRYGLDRLLHLMNMDNAANCDTLAQNLPTWIPDFGGMLARLRCFLHAVQLIAKMILKFFNKEYRRRRRGAADNAAPVNTDEDEHDELAETLEPEQLERDEQTRSTDPAKAAHDDEVVSAKKQQAIDEMETRGVSFTDADARKARTLLPKLAGLAIRIRDSNVVHAALDTILQDKDQNGQAVAPVDVRYAAGATTMATRNATRWDGDYNCLKSALALRLTLVKLMADRSLKLGAYKLDDEHWSMAADLFDVLSAIHDITMMFQQTDVPLIIEVLPAFIKLQRRLKNMSSSTELPELLRVAAHAGYLVSLEYFSKFQDCPAYAFAIALCPDRKLEWFRANGFSEEYIAKLRRDMISEFRTRWKPQPDDPTTTSTTSTPAAPRQPGAGRFDDPVTPPSTHAPLFGDPDDIVTYLDTPVTPIIQPPPRDPSEPPERNPIIPELFHWHLELQRVPHLAEMALAYVSAPATSADMERGFSEGRNQVSWNQRQMSQRVLKARMSICSWYRQPFWDMDIATELIGENSRPLRG